jgi:deazaflavin-dependent oxidoreductase (nitroreductase family)
MTTVQHLVRAIIAPLSRTRVFRALAPAALPPLERLLRLVTRGRVQVSGLLVPTLVLHSTGAKSGQLRETVLMYTPDGRGRAIVAGTSFARDRHPAWTYNRLAHPDADIEVRGRRLRVRARLIESEAREEAWRRIERQWPGYRGYERDSGRVVRLFLLQPIPTDPEKGAQHGRHAL